MSIDPKGRLDRILSDRRLVRGVLGTTISVILVALLLAGCAATQGQTHARQIATSAKSTLTSYKACLAPIEAKSEYAVIYDKIAVERTTEPSGTMPSAAQLNDPTRISESEIATGLRWYADAQQCAIPAMEALAQISPEFQQYFINNQREVTDILNEVVTTKPTFGKINQRLFVLKTSQKAAAAQIGQSLRNALLAEHEQELQDRAEVTQQLLDASVSLALSLATRQTVLIRSQRAFVAAHPRYASDPNIKTVHCTTINKTLSCSLI